MRSLQVPDLDAGLEATNAHSQQEDETQNSNETPKDRKQPTSAGLGKCDPHSTDDEGHDTRQHPSDRVSEITEHQPLSLPACLAQAHTARLGSPKQAPNRDQRAPV